MSDLTVAQACALTGARPTSVRERVRSLDRDAKARAARESSRALLAQLADPAVSHVR